MSDVDDTPRVPPLPRTGPKGIFVALVCSVCFLFAGESVARTQNPELAGVMVDAVDSGKSLAIIDGQRYRVGSRWRGLEVTQIGEGFVRLRETASGRERILTMGTYTIAPGTGRHRAHALKAVSATAVSRTQAVSVNLATIPEQDFFERINPLRLVWMAYTAMAQASLRQVDTAQQLFAINDLNYDGRDQYSTSLTELADHSLVQADLATGEKFGYRFSVRAWEDKLGPHYECIAEPVRADARQLYLYLDESGVIRGQLFARAGYNSPPIR